ncbi:hypothetical protein CORC01_08896 [Colletotrichum orchidophilum]|uniref:Methyltransferase domain-containing protein n=1 Tax=Colletotrichum orchidophilum TaxID=1209926 RepID=A0A1G4B358_9PEZI|nr:uncharacterized protein CORC01_08896 [Colletotrichum orchidophilum]OHE95755.1 hypothetical protein CORC01_08896 [Colletotrichum orchidophilum]
MAEVVHEVMIVPGDEDLDHDVSDMESIASSSTSITASILDYRIENCRTYHRCKDGSKLGLAPPCKVDSKVGRVLDVGTGTGVWANDFGDLHPQAEVLGVDLSAPQHDFVPPNVRFEIDDIEEEWTYSKPFDYIHSRFMNASIADWKKYVKKCYNNTVPGGYLEPLENQVDPVSDDNSLPKDSSILEYVHLIRSGSEKMGRVFVDVSTLKSLVIEAGFVDVELRIFKWPMNGWSKDKRYKKLGLWCHENFSSALEAVCMALLTRVHGWSRDEVDVFLVNVRKDLNNRSYHAYFPIYSVVGRRPEREEATASA